MADAIDQVLRDIDRKVHGPPLQTNSVDFEQRSKPFFTISLHDIIPSLQTTLVLVYILYLFLFVGGVSYILWTKYSYFDETNDKTKNKNKNKKIDANKELFGRGKYAQYVTLAVAYKVHDEVTSSNASLLDDNGQNGQTQKNDLRKDNNNNDTNNGNNLTKAGFDLTTVQDYDHISDSSNENDENNENEIGNNDINNVNRFENEEEKEAIKQSIEIGSNKSKTLRQMRKEREREQRQLYQQYKQRIENEKKQKRFEKLREKKNLKKEKLRQKREKNKMKNGGYYNSDGIMQATLNYFQRFWSNNTRLDENHID